MPASCTDFKAGEFIYPVRQNCTGAPPLPHVATAQLKFQQCRGLFNSSPLPFQFHMLFFGLALRGMTDSSESGRLVWTIHLQQSSPQFPNNACLLLEEGQAEILNPENIPLISQNPNFRTGRALMIILLSVNYSSFLYMYVFIYS